MDLTKRDPEREMDIKILQKETPEACNGDTWGTEDLQGPQRNLSGRPDGTSRDTKEASAGKQIGPKTPKGDQKRLQRGPKKTPNCNHWKIQKSSSRCSQSSIQHIERHPEMSSKTGCHKNDAQRTHDDRQKGSEGQLEAQEDPCPAMGERTHPECPGLGNPIYM